MNDSDQGYTSKFLQVRLCLNWNKVIGYSLTDPHSKLKDFFFMFGENLFSQHAEAATADFIQPHEGSTENCKPPKNTGMLTPSEADMTCGVKQSSMYIHSTQRAAFTLNIQHSF